MTSMLREQAETPSRLVVVAGRLQHAKWLGAHHIGHFNSLPNLSNSCCAAAMVHLVTRVGGLRCQL